MKRYLNIFLFFSILLILFQSSSNSLSNPIYSLIKDEIVHQTENMLGREISIGSVSGILVNQVTLKDIRIAKNKKISAGSVIYIKEARINYDVVKAGLARDFLPSISHVELIEPWIYVEYEKNGDWNILKLVKDQGGNAPPPPFLAKVFVKNGSALFWDNRGFGAKPRQIPFKENLSNINGIINLTQKEKMFFKANGKTKDESFFSEGRIDFRASRADIKISSLKLPIDKWNSFLEIPVLKNTDLRGFASANISAIISKDNVDLSGKIKIQEGRIYGRKSSGLISVDLKGKNTSVKISQGNLCGGRLSADLLLDSSENDPLVKGKINFSGVDLSQLSNNLFGTSGKTEGRIDISNRSSDLNISADILLADGFLLGQNADKIIVSSNIKDGNIYFNPLEIFNNGAKLTAAGEFDKYHKLKMSVNAAGFELKLPHVSGGIYSSVDKFEGTFEAKINNDFISNPLKYFNADVSAVLSNTHSGSQAFDLITMNGALNNGILDIKNLAVNKNGADIYAEGKIGLYKFAPSNVKITAERILISDFTSLSRFLPGQLKELSGTCSANLQVAGELAHDPLKNPMESLFDFASSVEAVVTNGSIAGQKFDLLNINVLLKDKSIFAKKIELKANNSSAFISGNILKSGSINLPFILNIDISDFRALTQKYASIFGSFISSGEVIGQLTNPSVNAVFSGKNISYNNLMIDNIDGRINYSDATVSTLGPVIFKKDRDEYSLTGKARLFSKKPVIEGRLFTQKGGLNSVFQIGQMIYAEVLKRRRLSLTIPKNIAVNINNLFLPRLSSFESNNKYTLFTPNNSFLKRWGAIEDDYKKTKVSLNPVKIEASGTLYADINFSINDKNIETKANLKTSKGSVGDYKFDGFSLSASLKDKMFNLDNFLFKKGQGYLEAHGKANLEDTADINITSKNLALDGIESTINYAIPIKGSLNLNASITGRLPSPRIASVFNLNNAEIREISMDNIHGEILFLGDTLNIGKFDVFSGAQHASLKGIIPFNAKKELNLEANLDGENAGILLSIFKGIKWSKGKGKAVIKVNGRYNKPEFNGYFFLKNGSVNINQLKTSIDNLNIGISANKNKITIKQLSGLLKGERTLNSQIPISIAGSADLSKAFDEKKIIGLDVLLTDFRGSIDIPSFYSGDISVSGGSIIGPLVLNADKKEILSPVISANIDLYDGHISLPKASNKKASFLPVSLNLSANLRRNIHLVQGEDQLLSAEMSKIEAYILADNLIITGLLSSPQILGDVSINSGFVSILGRDFELIPENTQEQFFSSDRSSVQKNAAVFSGLSGTIPDLSITAKSDVTIDTADTANADTKIKSAPVKEKIAVITKISGMPSVLEKPLNLKFYAFKEDKTKSPPEISPLQYDENQIRIILLPDILKSTLGFSKGGEPIDTNAVIVDYINSRLQSYLVKGLTSNLEKIFGLESFSLDYNFGRDLEKYLPTRRTETSDEQKQIGVGFVKGFFDRIYIQLRYAQAMNQTALLGQTSLNYQITWKINPNYSFVYYREPITFQDQMSTYYKMMLQSLHKY